MNIDRYKSDHVTIIRMVTDLKKLIAANVEAHAADIAQRIVSFSSTIKLHLAVEDQVLYPALRRNESAQIAHLAQRYQHEMGPIATDFSSFARRWNTERRIRESPEGMRQEALTILDRIHRRIQQENRELYPLAEQT